MCISEADRNRTWGKNKRIKNMDWPHLHFSIRRLKRTIKRHYLNIELCEDINRQLDYLRIMRGEMEYRLRGAI